MSTVSTIAISSVWATTRSARRCRCSARPAGPRSAHGRNAITAAVTAACAVVASPRAMSASFHDQSSGERSSNVVGDGTRTPPIRWSGLTVDALDHGAAATARHQASSSSVDV